MKPYKILSFDGGGIRGIYTAKLLSMLEKENPFLDQMDLFVGTSTGAILALILASGQSPDGIVDLYKNFGSAFFVPYEKQSEEFGRNPKYQNTFLKNLIEEHVFPSEFKLSHLKKKTMIPAFKLFDESKGRWAPHVFQNLQNDGEDPAVADVMLASGAAPIYFPSYQGYIDGGVFANNPSMLSACKALNLEDSLDDLSQIRLFSLGTGVMPHSIQKEVDFGSHGWFVKSPSKVPKHPFFSIVSDGINEVPHEMCRATLKSNYHRINTLHKNVVELDEYEKIPELLQEAERVPTDYAELWEKTLSFIEKKIKA